jgi:hypothetical protein
MRVGGMAIAQTIPVEMTSTTRRTAKFEDRGLISRVGPVEIDWPKANFGGIELVAPPLAIFIAAVPIFKLFKNPGQAWPLRVAADALEGAAKPIGGDAEAVVRLARDASAATRGEASRPRTIARRRSLRAA